MSISGRGNGKKVFVGLSGGVDSAVAAWLLQRADYEVVGVFMKNFSAEILIDGQLTPCWVPEWRDATRVAAHLKIPLLKFDFEEIYRREVLNYLYAEYAAGRTPNPDVLCNSQVKFGPFVDECLKQGADYIATGHYARINNCENSTSVTAALLRAVDEDKDQTYFLHQISRAALAHTLFPIGHLKKSKVRELARENKIPVAEKKDSAGICFVGEVSIREFLYDKIKTVSGNIVTTNREVVGRHDGLAWYTIGQRHGFGDVRAVAVNGVADRPWYVAAKNLATNELVIAPEYDPTLFTNKIIFERAHWINEPPTNTTLFVRLRHRQPLQKIRVLTDLNDGSYQLETVMLQRAVTPGQFAVIYSDTECFGGGVIK